MNKVIIVTRKEEDEEGEKLRRLEKWANGEVLYLIALRGEMEFEFTINMKKQGKFQFIEILKKN
jgi:hypothetical protein